VVALLAAAGCVLPAAPAQADRIRDAQWHLKFLNVGEAHTITQGAGVTVAVVDTGVDATHPDLIRNILPGGDLTPGRTDGRRDLIGHGTAMAGLVAGHGRGVNGILGIAPQAKILPVIVATGGSDVGGLYIEGGIRWAVLHGARVICTAFNSFDSPDTIREIQFALNNDVVIVGGVGNLPADTEVIYPAAYPGVLAAAGVDQASNHAATSTTGEQVVIAAPAVDVPATWLDHEYRTSTGTSNAAAITAGAAALVRAKYPNLSAREVVHRLTATADDKGPPGRDPEYGYGVLNLVKALTADVPPATPSPSPTAAQATTSPAASAQPDRPDTTTAIFIGIALLLLLTGAGAATYLLHRARR